MYSIEFGGSGWVELEPNQTTTDSHASYRNVSQTAN